MQHLSKGLILEGVTVRRDYYYSRPIIKPSTIRMGLLFDGKEGGLSKEIDIFYTTSLKGGKEGRERGDLY